MTPPISRYNSPHHPTQSGVSMLNRRPQVDWLTLSLWIASLAILVGCQPATEQGAVATAPLPTETAVAPTETPSIPTPTLQPSPEGSLGLVVWWPEPLAPLDNETAAEVLSEQLTAFQRDN